MAEKAFDQELARLNAEMQEQWKEGQKQNRLDEIALKKGIPRHWVEEAPKRHKTQSEREPLTDYESLANQEEELTKQRQEERKEFLSRIPEKKPSFWKRIKKLFRK